MVGTDELRQLAHLMRVSADTARMIAEAQPLTAAKILAVARQADELARELDTICRTVRVVPFPRRNPH